MCSHIAWRRGMAVLVVFLSTVSISQGGLVTPYEDPSFAPEWFYDCDDYKLWAVWGFDSDPSEMPEPEFWAYHKYQSLGAPKVRFGEGWTYDATQGRMTAVGSPEQKNFSFTVEIPNQRSLIRNKQVWLRFYLSSIQPFPQNLDVSAKIRWNDGEDHEADLGFTPEDPNVASIMDAYTILSPQPYREEVEFSFWIPETRDIYVDTLELCTQCNLVPEPTSILLWSALGGLGMIAARRRRRIG